MLLAACLALALPLLAPPGPGDDAVRYGRDIRPLLSDRCFQCHGGDPSSLQAGLRLDLPEVATADRGGYAAIVPGDLEGSVLWKRITSSDPDLVMPPPRAKKPALAQRDLARIAAWIEAGAAYEPHWAFVPPEAGEPPPVAHTEWVRDQLDAFVLAEIEAAGLTPSPPADPGALVRRVFLDLTGLPPTVEELDEALGSDAGAALDYEALVDRLFTEEPWRTRMAEHLAVGWLDAARYADTNGIHTDNGRQMWLWRDQLLRALRDNQPFDAFVVEQLAGDLIPGASLEQRIASGFNRNHVTTDEGGALPEEYLVEYAVDRVNTVSSVFLGLTAGCARCHDHKFDPITQDDYYRLLAYFNSIDEPGLYTQTDDADRAYEPFLDVPTEGQRARLEELDATVDDLRSRLEAPVPGEDEERRAFLEEVARSLGLAWTTPRLLDAHSSEPRTRLVPTDDGAVLAEGLHPQQEDYQLVLAAEPGPLRLLLLEALSVPGQAGAGRAGHGNAVISHLRLEQRPPGSEAPWREVPLVWAWSDHTQTNDDHEPTRVLEEDHGHGWAVDGNDRAGPRDLLLLSAAPFGSPQGSELRLTLAFRSPYAEHSLGHVRVRASPLDDTSSLAPALGRWWRVGPFTLDATSDPDVLLDTDFGPELAGRIDPDARFGALRRAWAFDGSLADARPSDLGDAPGVTYLGRSIWSPDARPLQVRVSADEDFVVSHDGERVLDSRALRQDDDAHAPLPLTLSLRPGHNAVVVEVVNTAGHARVTWDIDEPETVLRGELGTAHLPWDAVSDEQREDFRTAWRHGRSAEYRALAARHAAALEEREALAATVPATMVMAELPEPRPTHVLERGQYDLPDEGRPVTRRPPAFLPPPPPDAPADRLGLARWLVSDDNPLLARVTVNRVWARVFGRGLVRTVGDFGLQGAWPSHPALLDRLAVDFRRSGWDVHALLKRLVLSATYRQASTGRPELAQADPDDRLLARFPPRRLSAEQIRDLALATSGLLVERLGGPSVKPYQPDGLWAEVAMLASNTRRFARGEGEDLWRRSLYTYWKRAVPPPSLQLFDAPTRESCRVSRQSTNTPLQALVLWNDEQFVEAARALATRVVEHPAPRDDDASRLDWLLRTCTARRPDDAERALLGAALADFRTRFRGDEAAAEALLAVGDAPRPSNLDPAELAAWTLVSQAALNLHETLTQD